MAQIIPASTAESQETSPDNAAWFRYVLGQYPTGVTLITAAPDGSEPAGMVVGTFSSVSLDPPLVAFMPDVRSTSWPKIQAKTDSEPMNGATLIPAARDLREQPPGSTATSRT